MAFQNSAYCPFLKIDVEVTEENSLFSSLEVEPACLVLKKEKKKHIATIFLLTYGASAH